MKANDRIKELIGHWFATAIGEDTNGKRDGEEEET